MRTGAALLAGLLAWPPGAWPQASAAEPEAAVAGTLDDLARAVGSCRFALATDPAGLRRLADEVIRPALDVLFSGRIILGRWWDEASADQRRQFAESLYGSLANRYAPSLLLITDETVRILDSASPAAGGGGTAIPVVVRVPGYAPVPVELHLRRTGGHWRVFDARIQDLSAILQLRDELSGEIRRDGLEAVIRRLTAAAAPPRPSGQFANGCLERLGE
jgi:phospholipid transport system substrate-binding protein